MAVALEWYREAAEQGYAGAQFRLGQMLEEGQGVEVDNAKALEWYRKAAAQGLELAIARLNALTEDATTAETLPAGTEDRPTVAPEQPTEPPVPESAPAGTERSLGTAPIQEPASPIPPSATPSSEAPSAGTSWWSVHFERYFLLLGVATAVILYVLVGRGRRMPKAPGALKIQDPATLLGLLGLHLCLCVLLVVAVLDANLPGAALVCLATLLVLLLIRVRMPGIVIDPESDRFSFYGGYIAANEITDYLRPAWFLQWFRRYESKVSEITQIQRDTQSSVVSTGSQVKGNQFKVVKRHSVTVLGDWGVAKFRFKSGAKADQLYNSLRYHNQMGIPVV